MNSGRHGGALTFLQNRIKQVADHDIHVSMCRKHTDSLLEHKVIEIISESLFGECSCEVSASSTNKSLKILCLCLSKINNTIDIFSDIKNSENINFSWSNNLKKFVDFSTFKNYKNLHGPQKMLQYLLSNFSFSTPDIITYKIENLGCKGTPQKCT